MSWKKHFVVYQNKSPIPGNTNSKTRGEGYTSRFQSWLPEVYTGMPNRTERYMQYDQMDMDSEINMALDTIAEFSTQMDEETGSPFKISFKDDPTESEAKILKQALKQWCNLNDWDRRIFRTFRNVIKYGDQPFIRDPETWELLFVQPQDVIGVVINESKGKEPEQYIVKNLDLNLQTKTATTPIGINRTTGGITNSTFTTLTGRQTGVNTGYSSANISNSVDEFHVSSDNVVHVAMTEGMDPNFPFGSSILDPIFKTYKQKELLEDSIIIYRVQRAPERRVFYIDVGDMPAHRAAAFLEKVKMEVHQKRIPNKTGGGNNIMDAQYNPLSIMEDFFFAQGSDGRGSKVEVLPGGDNLGEISDLKFFTDKMMRGLRIPSSYMPLSSDDSGAVYTDGRVGTAFIQEFRFNKYCQRLQNIIQPVFDREFKRFLKHRGFNIDSSMFDLIFTEPQSFSQYRQIELDSAKAGVFGQLEGSRYLSRRFLLKKYLGLSPAEILENEQMYLEENPKGKIKASDLGNQMGLGDVGIRGSEFENLDNIDMEAPTEEELGGETAAPEAGVSPIGGNQPPAQGQEGQPR